MSKQRAPSSDNLRTSRHPSGDSQQAHVIIIMNTYNNMYVLISALFSQKAAIFSPPPFLPSKVIINLSSFNLVFEHEDSNTLVIISRLISFAEARKENKRKEEEEERKKKRKGGVEQTNKQVCKKKTGLPRQCLVT